MIKIRVASLEGLYYRKKELLYILIASIIYFNALIFSAMFADWPRSMLLIPKLLKSAVFDDRVPIPTRYGIFMVICYCT